MDKKELKFYEAPAAEVVDLELQGMLCVSGEVEAQLLAGSPNPDDPFDGSTEPTPETL